MFLAIEIDGQGYLNEYNKVQLVSLVHKLPKREIRKVTNQLSKLAIVSSFIISFSKYRTHIDSTNE